MPNPAPDLGLEVHRYPVGDLSTYHRNPRVGDVGAIAASLSARGQYKPIVVNLGTHTGRPFEVLAGNHTLLAARSLGWPTVQGVLLDVDDAEAAAIVAADNRIADLGAYDDAELAFVLQTAGDLAGTGYDSTDLDALLAALAEPVALTDRDDAPPIADVDPVSAVGDVWQLGPHRLVVGDCGDTDAVLAALGEDVVDAVWTDPPYGVDYVGHRTKRNAIANDGAEAAAEAFSGALRTIVAAARPGAPVYVAMPPGVDQYRFVLAALDAGIRVRQILLWVKDSFVVSRSDYHHRAEPIAAGFVDGDGVDDEDYEPFAYGFTPGGDGRLGRGGDHWHGDNRSSTVFQVKRPYASKLHPTMKPVDLIAPMLENSVRPGGLVLDTFGGSGSTLIAAHTVGRRALLVEYAPAYADVICRRWQEHTGIVPVRNGVAVDFTGGA